MRRGRGGLYRCLYHSFLNNTSLLLPSSKSFNHITVLFLLFSTLWLQLELFLSSGTICLSIYSLVAGIFGMNIPYTWNEDHGFMFKWVCNYLFHYLVNLGCEHLNAYKERLLPRGTSSASCTPTATSTRCFTTTYPEPPLPA